MRTALLVPQNPSSWTTGFHSAIQEAFSCDVIPLEPRPDMPDLSGYDVVISRLKFRHIAALPPIDWGGFQGLRVHFDEDGFWDALWSTSPYVGQWRKHIPRHGFDVLIVTGERAQDHFSAHGIRTLLVHKAFDPDVFRDFGGPRREEVVTYGADYPSRVLARKVLSDAGVPLQRVSARYNELKEVLNGYLAALVCTLNGRIRFRKLGQKLHRYFPQTFIEVGAGPEPMLKLFESAASGCATFVDWTPDLAPLGFRDGENIVSYRTLDELVEKFQHYLARPQELREIGAAGASLAHDQHTWRHRAVDLRAQLEPLVLGR